MYNDVPNTIAYSAGEKIPFRIAEQRVSRLQQELKAIGGDYLVIV
jgi:tRNA A37 methylthiotransferase MiaB